MDQEYAAILILYSAALVAKEEDDAVTPRVRIPHLTVQAKLGWITIITLLLTPTLMLASMAFLAFLWFSDRNNATWRNIIFGGWLAQAVTLCALALRTAASLQAGIATAMLAALALESRKGALPTHVASMATLRSTFSSPWSLLKPLLASYSRASNPFNLMLNWAVPLCLVTLTLQFTSTILFSDLRLGLLPGTSRTTVLAADFVYLEVDIPATNVTPAFSIAAQGGNSWRRQYVDESTVLSHLR